MKISLFPSVVCRTPVFPIDVDIESVWDDLKEFIAEASPSFYEHIKDCDYSDLASLPPKMTFTIWKYFNRAKYRATPFGRFAAFSKVAIDGTSKEKRTIVIDKELTVHEFDDWDHSDEVYNFNKISAIKSNSSFYQHSDEIRFIKKEASYFQLSSIGYDELAWSLLVFCENIQLLEVVKSFLKESGLPEYECADFIQEMINLQLLISDQHPNSIGNDYFSRMDYQTQFPDKKYILAERKWIAGAVIQKELKVLEELAIFMATHNPVSDSSEMLDFKRDFLKHFENKKVPLLQVLDPEFGIGYGSFAQELEEGGLVDKLAALTHSEHVKTPSYPYTPLLRFILNKLVLNRPVRLEDFKETTSLNNKNLPNTFSALIELVDDKLLLKSLGGVTANSFMGRFTLANEDIKIEAKKLVRAEEEANPDILFFDIGYQGEKNVDNVNRRASLYTYELPILGWSENEQQLNLNDILVTIRGEEVILFSEKYGKRIIPRLASAYNYVRSDLSVFRFLTDLQHQNVQSNLSIDLNSLLPELDYYPRICFKNIIINPARWLLPIGLSLSELESWLSSKEVGSFKVKEGDQTLLFSTSREEDIVALMHYAKNKKKVYIEEAFLPEVPFVVDGQGKSYVAEFIVNLINPGNLYQPYVLENNQDSKTVVQGLFLPAEHWLYYELCCHPFRSNDILLGLIEPFVSENKDSIEKWFFIRYTDPSYHIRFRMKFKKGAEVQLIQLFNKSLRSWTESKQILDVKIKPYHRELERYGSDRMDAVEDWFYHDSRLVLAVLSEKRTSQELYFFAMALIQAVFVNVMPSLAEQLSFVKMMTASFIQEHQVNKQGFKLINENYRQLVFDAKPNLFEQRKTTEIKQWEWQLAQLLDSCNLKEKETLLADLLHMFVNRLFHKEQRMHEMVVYELLRIKLRRVDSYQ